MVRITPALPWKIGYVALFLFVAAQFLTYPPWDLALREWTLKHGVCVLLGAACLLGAFTYPFKAVRLEPDAINENLWFIWRRHALPQRVTVVRDSGRVVVANADTGTQILSLAREFGPASEVEARLRVWLRQHGRLAPAS